MHKLIKIVCILILIISTNKVRAQKRFEDFHTYFFNNLKLPDSLKYDCTLHYAIVKMYVNGSGKISSYKLLNDEKPLMMTSLGFLKKYKFSNAANVKNRQIIFYFVYDNSEICKFSTKSYTIDKDYVLQEVWRVLGKEIDAHPGSLVIPEIISIKYPKKEY